MGRGTHGEISEATQRAGGPAVAARIQWNAMIRDCRAGGANARRAPAWGDGALGSPRVTAQLLSRPVAGELADAFADGAVGDAHELAITDHDFAADDHIRDRSRRERVDDILGEALERPQREIAGVQRDEIRCKPRRDAPDRQAE